MKILESFKSNANGPTGSTQLASFKNLDEQLRFLRRVVTKYRMTPVIRDLAVQILQEGNIASRDKRNQSLAIGAWVQEHVYYVHELPERFQYPDVTLRTRAGDCDDFSTLIAALLESIGIPSMLVAMKFDGQYRHIFAAARLDDGLLPLDATNRYSGVYGTNPIASTTGIGKQVRIKLA